MRFHLIRLTLVACGALCAAACSDSSTDAVNGSNGTVVVKMTDAPFPTDSVSAVNVYVVRVDARTADADSAAADQNLDTADSGGWTTLASPNAPIDLLTLQNGASTTIGSAALAAGTYSGFRLIIDPTRSNVTLKNGTVLTGTSSPSVTFPSASKSGIKIVLSNPVTVVGGATTTLLVDFDLEDSFVMRGNSIAKNGLLFKPVVRGSIIDAATVNALVRFANATDGTLSLDRNGVDLVGSSALIFGASSACNSITAAAPGLSVVTAGTTTALPGFSTSLVAGDNYTIVAYPGLGATQFATLRTNGFTPASGQAGIEVYNVSGLPTALDLFVGALGSATISNVATANGSAFVSVPAGSDQLRLAATGTQTVLLDLGTVNLAAGQNAVVVIAPPVAGSVVPRAFVVNGC